MRYPARITINGAPSRSSTETESWRGERVVGTQAGDRASDEQRLAVEFRSDVVSDQRGDQTEVERSRAQATMNLLLLGADDLDLGAQIRRAELLDRRRQHRDGSRVDRRHPHHPACLVLRVCRMAQSVHRIDHARHMRQELASVGAQSRAGAISLEDVDSEFALEVAHGLRQRRL